MGGGKVRGGSGEGGCVGCESFGFGRRRGDTGGGPGLGGRSCVGVAGSGVVGGGGEGDPQWGDMIA